MVHNPEVAGSSPAGALIQVRMRRGAKVARRRVSDAQLRRDTNTHSTAGAEYMAMQVRIPPGPLSRTVGPDPAVACKRRVGELLCPQLRRVSLNSSPTAGVEYIVTTIAREAGASQSPQGARRSAHTSSDRFCWKEAAMANKTSVLQHQEPAAARDGHQRGRRPRLPACAEARAGAARGDGLLQRHVLRQRPRASSTSCSS